MNNESLSIISVISAAIYLQLLCASEFKIPIFCSPFIPECLWGIRRRTGRTLQEVEGSIHNSSDEGVIL